MASKILDFMSIDEELKYLKNRQVNFTNKLSKTNQIEIQIQIRKCLALILTVPKSYPALSPPTSVECYSAEIQKLKTGRREFVEDFLKDTNAKLNEIVKASKKKCCVVKLFESVQEILEKEESSNSLLTESFKLLPYLENCGQVSLPSKKSREENKTSKAETNANLETEKVLTSYNYIPLEYFNDFYDISPIADEAANLENQLADGKCLSFLRTEWVDKLNDLSQTRPFVRDFKLLTYNVMSRRNLKKCLESKNLMLKNIENLERMSVISEIFEKNQPTLILLQECEKYELKKLCENEFIRESYTLCTSSDANKNSKYDIDDGLVIFCKHQPVFVKQLKLSPNSEKLALVAKFSFRIDRLRQLYEILIVNVHLTSNKAINGVGKRKEQLATLREYLIDKANELDLKCDYLFIGGDFNTSDDSFYLGIVDSKGIDEIFLKDGFIDLAPKNVHTFDPMTNLAASLTKWKADTSERYDRVLFKSFEKSKTKQIDYVASRLVGTAPFKLEIKTESDKITHESYLKIRGYTAKHQLELNAEEQKNSNLVLSHLSENAIEDNQFFFHP